MKVLLVEPWATGGTRDYAIQLAQSLSTTSSSSDSVQLLCSKGAATSNRNNRFIVDALPSLEGDGSGNPARRLRQLARRRRLQAEAIKKHVRDARPDTLHLLGSSLLPLSEASELRSILPIVATVHDIPRLTRSRSQWAYLLWSIGTFRSARTLIVHGEWSRARLESLPFRHLGTRNKTRVVPLGIGERTARAASPEQTRRSLLVPNDVPLVCFIGSTRADKGLPLLLKALAQAQDSFAVIIARPASRGDASIESIKRTAAELGILGRVRWISEYIPAENLNEIVGASNTVALPYGKGFAGQSSVLALAAHNRVPVVATNVGDIGTTVSRYGLGLVVAPNDPGELARGIKEVVLKENIDEESQRALLAIFGLTSVAHEHWKIYERAIGIERRESDHESR